MPSSQDRTISAEWTVLGEIRNSQYNTVHESKCSTTTSQFWKYNPSCVFEKVNLRTNFASQTQVNGTGVSVAYGTLKAGTATANSLCTGKFPNGATRTNSFLTVSEITGSCNKLLTGGQDDAIYPNPASTKNGPPPYPCGDDLRYVALFSDQNTYLKKVEDYCPACSGGFNRTQGHVDNYTSNQACSAHSVGDLGDFWEADTTMLATPAPVHAQIRIQGGLFDPQHQPPVSYQRDDVALRLTQLTDRSLAVLVDRRGSSFVVPLPTEVVQINEIRTWSDNRAVAIGMLNGSVFEMTIIDLEKRAVLDHFLGFSPALSPNSRFVAYIKFYPPHFSDNPVDHYMIYDLGKSPSENRPASIGGSDFLNVGLTIYPIGVGNKDGDNVGVSEEGAHHAAGEFFWSADSQKLVFADQSDSPSLLLMKIALGNSAVSTSILPLQTTDVCVFPLFHDGYCESRLRGVRFEGTAVKAEFNGLGSRASVHRELTISEDEFLAGTQ